MRILKPWNFCNKAKTNTNYDVFNIGSGDGVTVLEAVNAFERNTAGKS